MLARPVGSIRCVRGREAGRPIELGQMRYREPKRQTKDCHSEGDSGDRQQNLYCGFTPTDAAGPAFEWVRSPLSERGFGERASSLSVP
jgi:hypothetical protein